MTTRAWTFLIPALMLFFFRPIVLEANEVLFEFEAGVSHEELDSDYDDWKSKYLEALVRLEERKTFHVGIRETNRFSLYDTELMAGMSYLARERVTLNIEGSESPTHEILPEWSLLGQAEIGLPKGWGTAIGLKTTEYANSTVYQGTITLNKYWSNYLASYTFYTTRVEDAGNGESHRVQLYYFYGQNSSASIGYSNGREVESIGEGEVLVSNVQTINLYGRHWFSPDWAVSWELSEHRQGDRYTRRGGRIGIRYAF